MTLKGALTFNAQFLPLNPFEDVRENPRLVLVLQTGNGLKEEGIVVFDKIPLLGFGYDILGRGFTPHSDKTQLAIGDPERKFLHKLWLWVWVSLSFSL